MPTLLQVSTSTLSGSPTGTTAQTTVKSTQPPEPEPTVPDLMAVCLVIVGAGLVGGWLNFLRTGGSPTVPGATNKNYVPLCLVSGVVACALVPLFLKTIQSELLTGTRVTPYDYLIFTGLCLIAAVFSSTFIDTLSKRVLDQLTTKVTAVEAKTDANTVVAQEATQKATAAQTSAQTATNQAGQATQAAQTASRKIAPVLSALTDRKLTGLTGVQPNTRSLGLELESFDPNAATPAVRTVILTPGVLFRSAETVASETGKSINAVLTVFADLVQEGKAEPVSLEAHEHIYAIKN